MLRTGAVREAMLQPLAPQRNPRRRASFRAAWRLRCVFVSQRVFPKCVTMSFRLLLRRETRRLWTLSTTSSHNSVQQCTQKYGGTFGSTNALFGLTPFAKQCSSLWHRNSWLHTTQSWASLSHFMSRGVFAAYSFSQRVSPQNMRSNVISRRDVRIVSATRGCSFHLSQWSPL